MLRALEIEIKRREPFNSTGPAASASSKGRDPAGTGNSAVSTFSPVPGIYSALIPAGKSSGSALLPGSNPASPED